MDTDVPPIPPALVEAIIQVESGGSPGCAWRVEPNYSYLWDVKSKTPLRIAASREAPKRFHAPHFYSKATEFWGQKASWGPMQIMGAVARELGFRGPFTELCGEKGVEYGMKYLLRLKQRWFEAYGWPGVISSYNHGYPEQGVEGFANQNYVNKVLNLVE